MLTNIATILVCLFLIFTHTALANDECNNPFNSKIHIDAIIIKIENQTITLKLIKNALSRNKFLINQQFMDKISHFPKGKRIRITAKGNKALEFCVYE